MGLREDVERDFAGMGQPLKAPYAGPVNLGNRSPDEQFKLLLARLDGVQSAIRRLADRLDKIG